MAKPTKVYVYEPVTDDQGNPVIGADGRPATRKTWNGKWRARWLDASGKQKSEVFSTEKAAASAIRRHEVKRDEIRSGLAMPLSDKLLREVAADWIKTRPAARQHDDQSHLDHHILPQLGDVPMPEVAQQIEAFKRHMESKQTCRNGEKTHKPLKPATIQRTLQTLGKLLRDNGYAVSIGYAVPEQSHGWIRDPADVAKYLAVCTPEWFKIASALALYAGLRKSEVAGLLRNRLDFERELILIDHSYDKPWPKGKRPRHAPLGPELAALLKPWLLRHSGPLVVTVPDEDGRHPITRKTDLASRARKICKRAGIEDNICFHQARHTSASHLAESNPAAVVKELLGHKHLSTTERYMHTNEDTAARRTTAQLSFKAPAGQVIDFPKKAQDG